MAFVIALLPVSTYAQAVENEPITNEEASNDACNVAKQRIATQAKKITTLQTDHSAKYATMKGRIDTFAITAATAKYTAINELTATRDGLTTALSVFNSQAKIYKTSLETAQAATCGEEDGQFTPALEAARAELVSLRSTATAVKTSIKQSVAPALRDYASWLKATADTNEEKL